MYQGDLKDEPNSLLVSYSFDPEIELPEFLADYDYVIGSKSPKLQLIITNISKLEFLGAKLFIGDSPSDGQVNPDGTVKFSGYFLTLSSSQGDYEQFAASGPYTRIPFLPSGKSFPMELNLSSSFGGNLTILFRVESNRTPPVKFHSIKDSKLISIPSPNIWQDKVFVIREPDFKQLIRSKNNTEKSNRERLFQIFIALLGLIFLTYNFFHK